MMLFFMWPFFVSESERKKEWTRMTLWLCDESQKPNPVRSHPVPLNPFRVLTIQWTPFQGFSLNLDTQRRGVNRKWTVWAGCGRDCDCRCSSCVWGPHYGALQRQRHTGAQGHGSVATATISRCTDTGREAKRARCFTAPNEAGSGTSSLSLRSTQAQILS